MTSCLKILCNVTVKRPHHLENVLFVKVADLENPENIPKLIVFDDLMDSAYSTKVSQLFTKRSHHRNIPVELITQNLFQQLATSRDISLNRKETVPERL